MPESEGGLGGGDSHIDAVVFDHEAISNYNPGQTLSEPPEDSTKVRSRLKPTSYNTPGGEYRKHLASHVADTGTWLTSSAAYQKWLQSDKHELLWIKRITGSESS
jgi:hypothetical protein